MKSTSSSPAPITVGLLSAWDPPAPCSPYGHPAAHKAVLGLRQATQPPAAVSRRRRNHQASREGFVLGQLGESHRRWHGNPRLSVGRHQSIDGAMEQHRLLDAESLQLGEHPLCLPKGVAEEHRRPVRRAAPPVDDFTGHLRPALPAVDGKAKGGFADEDVGLYGLKGFAAGVGAALVVAADQPALSGPPVGSGRCRARVLPSERRPERRQCGSGPRSPPATD